MSSTRGKAFTATGGNVFAAQNEPERAAKFFYCAPLSAETQKLTGWRKPMSQN